MSHAVAKDREASRPPDYDDLLGLVDLGELAVSPNGKLLAIEARRADRTDNRVHSEWLVVPLTGDRAAVRVGEGGEPLLATYRGLRVGLFGSERPAVWSTDSTSFFYRARHADEIQLWRSSTNGLAQERLTNNAGDVRRYAISRDGKRVLYAVGRSRAEHEAANAAEGARGFLYDERFIPGHRLSPLDDEDNGGSDAEDLWVVDIASRSERRANSEEQHEWHVAHSKDDALRGPQVREPTSSMPRVELLDLRENRTAGVDVPRTLVAWRGPEASAPFVCRAAECTGRFIGAWSWRPDKAVFLRWTGEYDYGTASLYEWTFDGAVREIFRTADLIEDCHLVERRLICAHESATSPRKIVAIELPSGRMTTIFDPNPNFRDLMFGDVTPVHWRDPSGVDGFGHLVKPIGFTAGVRYPLVIVQYRSRGFLRGGVGDEYPIHVLAAKGFVVLSFHRPDEWELRSRASSYDEVVREGWREFRDRRTILSVLLSGIDALVSEGVVDVKRVGITGMSDGGINAAFALIHAPTRFAAAAVSWTVWNPIDFYLAGPRRQPVLAAYGFGNPDTSDTLSQWRGISLALNAERVLTPLLIQVNDSELLSATQTVADFRHHGKPVEMYVFPNEYHVKSHPAHRFHVYKRSVQWFRFWLQEIEEPDPLDPEQYSRWRALLELRNRGATPAFSGINPPSLPAR